MLACKDIVDQATAYLEDELPWLARLRVRLHLILCALCRRYMSQMAATRAVLRQLTGSRVSGTPIDSATRETFRVWRDETRRH